ncbi:hypothetical protein [Pedobacter sp. ASV28]|uniref:hypothetical protein n=1 Tax=Pedobacter sp. ASV28 TaxID=2795123 RepID=UPI0018EBB0C6|nr:hypothetical protein [Pedobacter sp. ASV28]
MNHILFLTMMMIILSIGFSGCKKNDHQKRKTLEKIYVFYKDGKIGECKYNGQTVYSAILNAYDANGQIYNKNGDVIGSCNYAWGKADDICKQITDCKSIYVVEDNIWREPAINKYNLGK